MTQSEMRVLHIMPSIARSYGGPAFSLWGYVQAALRTGAEVTVIAPSDKGGHTVMSEGLSVTVRTFAAGGEGAFVVSPALWRWLRRNGQDYDVIHVHGLLNLVSSLSVRLCIRYNWPVVVRPFGTLSRFTFSYRRRMLKRAFFDSLDRPNLKRVGAVHFTSSGEMQNADWHGLDLGKKAYVIPPPWMPAQPIFPRRVSDTPRILFLGRLHPVKAIDALLASFALVVRDLPTARLIIAGDGDASYVSELRALARAMQIESATEFVGFADANEKSQLLASASVFVLPSHHENFGFAVIEAVAAGVPVVITPEVLCAEFVEAHGLGQVTSKETAALASTLSSVMLDADLGERCRTQGRRRVEDTFAPEVIGIRLMAMYEFAIATVST